MNLVLHLYNLKYFDYTLRSQNLRLQHTHIRFLGWSLVPWQSSQMPAHKTPNKHIYVFIHLIVKEVQFLPKAKFESRQNALLEHCV